MAQHFFKVVSGLMEDKDLCTKLSELLEQKDFEVISIVNNNGTEIAYCVDLNMVFANNPAPDEPTLFEKIFHKEKEHEVADTEKKTKAKKSK